VHSQTDNAVDDAAMFLMDNLDQIEEYSHFHHSDFVGYTSDSMENTLLLDSCSTVNLIAN
jgi:hypothetical protein